MVRNCCYFALTNVGLLHSFSPLLLWLTHLVSFTSFYGEMATPSSILAWKTPWTEEPDGLQSMGIARVGHDWATNTHKVFLGFPGGARGKEPACQCRRHKGRGSISESGRSSGGGYGNPLQYPCQDNPMDRRAWQAMVHGVSKSWTWIKWPSMHVGCFWHLS